MMHISPISVSTDYKKPSFEARFCKQNLATLIEETVQYHNADALPKLYVLLEYLNEFHGKIAEFCKKDNFTILKIDNQQVGDKYHAGTGFETLMHILVGDFSSKQYIRMPNNVFERKWWSKRKVSPKTLETFAYIETKKTNPIIINPYDVRKNPYRLNDEKIIMLSNIQILEMQKTQDGQNRLNEIITQMIATDYDKIERILEETRKELEIRQKKYPNIYKS